MDTIGLRQATWVDSAWCYQLHRAAMRGCVEAVWGWDEEFQQAFHRSRFDPAKVRIITVDGRDAGVLITECRPTEIYLRRIAIHPDHQGRGIGSRIIDQVRRAALDRDLPIELDVLVVNTRAHALYRRIGFRDVARHGPDNIKIRMRLSPRAGTGTGTTERE